MNQVDIDNPRRHKSWEAGTLAPGQQDRFLREERVFLDEDCDERIIIPSPAGGYDALRFWLEHGGPRSVYQEKTGLTDEDLHILIESARRNNLIGECDGYEWGDEREYVDPFWYELDPVQLTHHVGREMAKMKKHSNMRHLGWLA